MMTTELLLALAISLGGVNPPEGVPGWRCGLARTVITPEEPLWLSGYASRRRPAQGKLHDLWAKALVLEDATGKQAVLVTLDLIGLDASTSRRMTQAISDTTGIPDAAIALACSHTHTGPVVGDNLRSMYELTDAANAAIDRYTDQLVERVVATVVSAREDLAPAIVEQAMGEASFAVNRRNNPEREVIARRSEQTLVGPVDHRVPVLLVKSTDGALRGLVFGYACHATVLSIDQYSGDYPGYAQLALESRFEGVTAMFWAGCGADQNPLPRREIELAERYGDELADAVETVVEKGGTKLGPLLQCRRSDVELAFAEIPTEAQLRKTAQEGSRYEAGRARSLLERQWWKGSGPDRYPVPVQGWLLGDLRWVFLGGEVVVDYALAIGKGDAPSTWVTAYANDVMAYIPSERVLREGGYEGAGAMVYYGLPSPWAPGLEVPLVEAAAKVVEPTRPTATVKPSAVAQPSTPLEIATFQVDVTPPLGSPLCDGLVAPASSIADRLSARGMMLRWPGESSVVLCAVDWVGIGNAGQDEWRAAIASAANTTVDRVAVHALHQHDAPGCDFYADDIARDADLADVIFPVEFAREAIARVAEAVGDIVWRPVTHLGFGHAEVDRVASNRRILGPDGKVARIRFSRCTDAQTVAAPEGVIDPDLMLVSYWHQDEPLVAASYYATHPQSYYGGGAVGSDFVGMARTIRESQLPGVFHVHFNGAGGNVAAGKYNDGSAQRRPELARRLAAGMRGAWEATTLVEVATLPTPQWRSSDVVLPLRSWLAEEERSLSALHRESLATRDRIRAARDLAFSRRMRAGQGVPLSCLHLGDIRLLHLPGELFVEYQLAARAMVPHREVCVAAYGDYGPGYIGTEISYEQGGYETGVVSRVDPSVQGILEQEIARLVADRPGSNGFASIFDGESLAGWSAVPEDSSTDWSVVDGVIVGRGSKKRQSYLVFDDRELGDFVLELSVRLPGKGNSGVELRAQPDETGKRHFEGYHADFGHVGIGDHILGAWDFHFATRREFPCRRGTRLRIANDGEAHSEPIVGAVALHEIEAGEWNRLRIVARGRQFEYYINDRLSSAFTDELDDGRLSTGAIGLQIHDPGMAVEFRDLRLLRLER